jgi:hypothetical protein
MAGSNMSDENTGTPAPTEPDRLGNLQAEFERKFGNTSQQLAQTQQQLAEVLARLPKPQAPEPEDDGDLLYQNPKAFKQKLTSSIDQRVEERVNRIIETRSAKDNERISTLQSLAADYPELNKADSPLYQETVKALGEMPAEVRNSAQAYQLAVFKKAAELGLKPISKRDPSSGVENFSFDGKKTSAPRKKSDPSSDINENTLTWMELMDPERKYFDPSKEADVEDLKKRSKKDYRKPHYE